MEIGGYLELERNRSTLLHEDAAALNCGRNCLLYLIRTRKIKKICIPGFLCDCIRETCEKEELKIRYYDVDIDFRPQVTSLEDDEWLYFVNYYGQFSTEWIRGFSDKFQRVIVDQAQAYFQPPISGADTIYTCRKFFGVADGAFLYTDAESEEELPVDISYERMRFVLGRFEKNASEFYGESSANNERFAEEPIKKMSCLTENILRGIDYTFVKERRTQNYLYLYRRFLSVNKLRLSKIEGAFAYPLLVDHGAEVRRKLLEYKIYIPTLWPNVLTETSPDSLAYRMAKNILPLPCDQRYSLNEMEAMCGIIEGFL